MAGEAEVTRLRGAPVPPGYAAHLSSRRRMSYRMPAVSTRWSAVRMRSLLLGRSQENSRVHSLRNGLHAAQAQPDGVGSKERSFQAPGRDVRTATPHGVSARRDSVLGTSSCRHPGPPPCDRSGSWRPAQGKFSGNGPTGHPPCQVRLGARPACSLGLQAPKIVRKLGELRDPLSACYDLYRPVVRPLHWLFGASSHERAQRRPAAP